MAQLSVSFVPVALGYDVPIQGCGRGLLNSVLNREGCN